MIHAELTMRSTVLGMDTQVDVLIPEDRRKTTNTKGKEYPVLYVLHGGGENNKSWMRLSNIELLSRDLDLIIVFPSVCNSFYVDTAYGFKYYTYITEELPTKLRNFLPITEDVKQTFVMGESMGGYGTMRVAFANPDKYGKAVVLSAGNATDFIEEGRPFNRNIFGNDDEVIYASDNNIYNLIDKLKDYEGEKPAYRFYCGTEDFAYPDSLKVVTYMQEKLPDWDIDKEYWPGQHNFFFWNQAIPKALEFFGFKIEENSVI